MANRLKKAACCFCCSCCCYWTFLFVHILFVFISASLARDITDEVVFPDQQYNNSSFPLAYQNNSTSAALSNNRRRTTSRWRTTDPVGPTTPATTTTTTWHDEQRRPLLSDVAQVPVTLLWASSGATVHSPQSGDVAQQSWTIRPIRPRPRTGAGDHRDAVTSVSPRWTADRVLPVVGGSESPLEMGSQHRTSEVVTTIASDGELTLSDSFLSTTTVAADVKYTKTSPDDQDDDGTDYASDYNDHENDEDDDGGDDDEDDEDYDDYDDDDEDDDDDERNEFYDYDEDYDENDNRRHRDSDSYEGGEYPDGSDTDVHQYGTGDGSMRKPFNYTDISDPGSREIRRLVINGKSSSHIDMSLLVIYAWLGLVVIMIAITVIIFKYKQQLSTRCLKVTSSCRKVRQVIGIEEGNNLLAHPLV